MPCRLLLALSTSSLALGLAQAQAIDDEQRVETTVFVTAPGPERGADELIGNATAFDRDDILQTLSASLGDTLTSVPGVASSTFGQGASRPVLRGLGAERVQVLTNGIGVIDASAASPDHQVSADGIDAQRIEILRGPAALAYGGQAIGGVVNVIDGLIAETLPGAPVSGDVFGAFNSVNEGSELAGRAQFSSGPFVLTLSASHRDFDNYDIPGFAESALFRSLEEAEEDHGDEDHDEEEQGEEEARDTLENAFVETETLAAGLSWVGDKAFLGVAVRQQTSEYGLPGHGEHGHGEHDEEAHEDEDHDDVDHEEESHGEEEENPFIDLEHTRIDLRGGIELAETGLFTDLLGTFALVDYQHAEFEAPGETGTLYESEGYEGRIEIGNAIAGFEGALGLQIINKSLSATGEEAFITPTDTRSVSVFVYETKEWESGIGIEAGARFETVELDNVNVSSRDFDLASGAFGLHRHLEGGVFMGGQISYTERAPSEPELYADGPHLATEQFEVGNPDLGKESALNLEGTLRWKQDFGSVGVNLFITDFSDFIYLRPGQTMEDGALVSEADGLPVFLYTQEDADFFGAEIYADMTLRADLFGASWHANASLDFVEAELSSGENVPYIPPTTFRAGIHADWSQFELGAMLTHASDQPDSGMGQLRTDGYTFLNLRAATDLTQFGLGSDGTHAFIELRNLNDEEVRFATSVLKDVAPAPGRNIRAGIRIAF